MERFSENNKKKYNKISLKIVKKLFILAAAAFVLCGCGGTGAGTKVAGGTVQNVTTKQEEQTEAVTEKASGEDDASKKGYAFSISGMDIFVDEDAQPYIDVLGEADDYYEAVSCAFDGNDKAYIYDGFELDTYPSKYGDRVLSVIFLSDSVSTAEGIFIGSSEEDVINAYGADYETKDDFMIYPGAGMKLSFEVKDGHVAGIEYLSRVYD